MNHPIPLWQALASVMVVSVLGVIGHLIAIQKLRTDLTQKNFENSMRVVETHDAAYRNYVSALTTYIGLSAPNFEEFMKLVSAGDVYFHQASLICNSMLSGLVDPNIRDNTWMPKIRKVFEKTLPDHYQTLEGEARKRGFPWKGELRREDHESIYAAAEFFSLTDAWVRPHEKA